MKRIGQFVFLCAVVLALALYWITAPDGLPWNQSTHLALAYLGEIVRLPSMPHPVWGCYVQVFGGAVALSAFMAAVAAGLIAVLVNRYFGWRFAASAALVWIFLPGVWNRAISGERGVCLAAMAVVAMWAVDGVARRVLLKAREMMAAKNARGAQGLSALPAARDALEKRGKVNRIVGWVAMGGAALFAVTSLTLHDYRYGEAASVFARGVVEEAGERVIVLNGACDGQVVVEVERVGEGGQRQKESGAKRRVHCSPSPHLFTLSLRTDDAYRMSLLAWVRSAFPTETNLWVAAQVSAAAFAKTAAKSHPERFYMMGGSSATREGWERRWEDFKPYLESSDPFVRVARRLFGCEGNAVANAMLDGEVEKRGGGGQWNGSISDKRSGDRFPAVGQPSGEAAFQPLNQDEAGAKRHVHCPPPPTISTSSSTAWRMYKRIYTEVDPGNISALVNMSEMIRRGHAVSGDEKKKVQEALETFFKDASNRQRVRELVRAAGPVRADPALVERMAAEAKTRIAAKIAAGEKIEYSPEILSLVEWNNAMVKLMDKGELVQAGRIARAILSNPKWQGFVPANAVMGAVAAQEGDYVSSAAFLKVATDATNDVPAVVRNDYADALIHLGRMDEAERQARWAVKASEESFWVARLTLAQVLEKKVRGEGDCFDSAPDAEIRDLLRSALKFAPAKVCDRIRQEHRGYVR